MVTTQATSDAGLDGSALPYRFLAAIFAVNTMAFLNFVGVFIAMVSIAHSLDAPTVLTLQLPTVLYIAVACAAPTTPYLMQRLGARRLLTWAIAGMCLTSLAAALADSIWPLLLILFIHGLFCAPVSPATQSAVSTVLAGSERDLGIGMAVWGAGNYASYLVGPLLAGWLVDHYGWHAILLLPLPFAVLALPLVVLAFPHDAPRQPPAGDAATLALAPPLLLLLLAVTTLGPALGWFTSPLVLACAGGLVILVPLYARVYRRTRDPQFNLGCLLDRFAGLSLLLVLVYNMLNTGLFQVEFLGQIAHLDAGILGVRAAVGGGTLLLGFVIAGWLSRREHHGICLIGGIAVGLAGKAGYLIYGSHIDAFQAIWPVGITSVGFGMVTASLATLAYRTIDRRHVVHVATAFILAIYLGASLGAGMLDEIYVMLDSIDLSDAMNTIGAESASFHSEFWVEFAGTALLAIPAWILLRRNRAFNRTAKAKTTT